jgi:AraC-like DNA-binding protein
MASIVNVSNEDACAYYQPRTYFEIDTLFIPAHEWPSALIDLALNRGLEEHKLLRGTGIFREDISDQNLRLSPQQCFQLIINMQKHIHSHELSFLLGHRFFPALGNSVSRALNNAASLQAAIDILIEHQTSLLPLLNLRSCYEQDRLVIYWQDAYGAGTTLIFLLEMVSTALSALARRHSGENLPWQFYFMHNKPSYIEQYEVHLNNNLEFSSQINAMAIARDYLHTPWLSIPRKKGCAAEASRTLAANDLHQQLRIIQRGFLSELYNYLHYNIQHNPNLEQTAEDFGMSSASLKRKLKKHHSHFQEQYDLVRKDLALYWLHQAGWSKEQVAKKLHFYDAANLRRALKKWTGNLLPTMQKRG